MFTLVSYPSHIISIYVYILVNGYPYISHRPIHAREISYFNFCIHLLDTVDFFTHPFRDDILKVTFYNRYPSFRKPQRRVSSSRSSSVRWPASPPTNVALWRSSRYVLRCISSLYPCLSLRLPKCVSKTRNRSVGELAGKGGRGRRAFPPSFSLARHLHVFCYIPHRYIVTVPADGCYFSCHARGYDRNGPVFLSTPLPPHPPSLLFLSRRSARTSARSSSPRRSSVPTVAEKPSARNFPRSCATRPRSR